MGAVLIKLFLVAWSIYAFVKAENAIVAMERNWTFGPPDPDPRAHVNVVRFYRGVVTIIGLSALVSLLHQLG